MKRTPLYDAHKRCGARFVDFGGWEMPVQYTGIIDEHTAVRTRAGLFDVSHMGEVELRGPKAFAAVQELTVNDLSRIGDGQAQYSMFCLPSGGIIDDIMIYRHAKDRIMICLNASNTEKDIAWIREHAGGAEVVDRSEETALIALQGPHATSILAAVVTGPLESVARFAFIETEISGKAALAARTGYTGEDGWEIYCDAGDATAIWDTLLDAGAATGLQPAGLGARDTLRLEAALPLYGNDLDEETTPLEARMGWVVRLKKPSFIGREALARQKTDGVRRRLTGFVMEGRGIGRAGHPIIDDGTVIGRVTSGTKSPTLGKAIGLGYVPPHHAGAGSHLGIDIRGRVTEARVTALPFYRRQEAGGS